MRRSVLAIAIASALPACLLDTEEPVSSNSQSVTGWNRLAGNRLAGNRLAGNRLAGNRLAGNALSSTRLVALAETAEILNDADGREVYSYMVSCALPFPKTIEADVPGAPNTAPPLTNYTCSNEHCVFDGNLGLAPDWENEKLDKAGEGWVSACLFARVNAFVTAEEISLRGRNMSLAVTTEEASTYSVQEGGFYGNIFDNGKGEPEWYACRGEGQAAGESGGLALRDCTEENPAKPGYTMCGFHYAGDCGDYSPDFPSPAACETYDAGQGIFGSCHEELASKAGSFKGPKHAQVITVYVSP